MSVGKKKGNAAAHHRDDTSPAHHGKDMVRTYLVIFAVLIVLTLLTVGTAYLELPESVAIVTAIIIALTKAALIAMFFMHMKGEARLINFSMALAVMAVLVLVLFVMPDLGIGPNGGGGGWVQTPVAQDAAPHGAHHE